MTTLTTTETCDFCGNPGEQLKPVKRPHIMDPTLDGKETYRLCNIHQCTYILDGKGRCTDRVNEGEGTIDQSSKKGKTRKDISTYCLAHIATHNKGNLRKAKQRSPSKSPWPASLYVVGEDAESKIRGRQIKVQSGMHIILPDSRNIPEMEGRGYELDELIRRSKTVSDSDSVKVFKKGSDTREAMCAWISTHATTAAAHQDPPETEPKLRFQTAWLQYCHGTPGLQEVLTECIAGPEQKTVTSTSFPFPHAKDLPEQNSEARFWAAAIDAQADDAQAYSKIIASEGSIVVSTAGKLVKSELESMGTEVVLHVGLQLWFIGGEAMVILRQGDVLILRPGTSYSYYSVEPSIQHQRSFLRYDWIESGLVKAAEDDLAKIYLCLMVLALFVDSTFAQKHGLVHPKLRQLVQDIVKTTQPSSSTSSTSLPLEQLKKHCRQRMGTMVRAEENAAGSSGKRARDGDMPEVEQRGRADKRLRGSEEEGGAGESSGAAGQEARQEIERSSEVPGEQVEAEEQGIEQEL